MSDKPESYTTDLEAEVRAHFNEPILTDRGVGRVVGYSEDACDCYITIRYLGGELIHHTMAGGYYWLDRLRGQNYVKSIEGEDWDDLFRLDRVLELNGSPREEEFLCDRREVPDETARNNTPLTEAMIEVGAIAHWKALDNEPPEDTSWNRLSSAHQDHFRAQVRQIYLAMEAAREE